MPSVAAVYTNVMVRPWADVVANVPPPTQMTIELGSAPAAGDVVVMFLSPVPYRLFPPSVAPPIDHTLITGPIDGFAPLERYSSLAVTHVGALSRYKYWDVLAYRADGTESAGTVTIPFAWGDEVEHPAELRNRIVSQAMAVVYLRGLPDTTGNIGWDLLPRVDQSWMGDTNGQPSLDQGQNFVQAVPMDCAWNQSSFGSGPGYRSDYNAAVVGMELYPGQLALAYLITSDAGQIELFNEKPAGAYTTQAVLDLGVISPTDTRHGSALLASGEATARSRWTFGVDSPEGPDANYGSNVYFLPFGYAPDTVTQHLGSPILRYVPTTGYSAGYHRANAYQLATYPIGAAPGDLALMIVTDRYLPSLPAGWTTYKVGSVSGMSYRVAYRVITTEDLVAGGFDYVLAGVGTGEWMITAYKSGTYLLGEPIREFVDSTDPAVTTLLPWTQTFAGEALWCYSAAKITPSVVGGDQVTLYEVDGSGLGPGKPSTQIRRNVDPDWRTDLAYSAWQKDCTQQGRWGKTTDTAITAMYRASWVMNTPDSAVVWLPWDTTAQLLTAQYAAEVVTPGPDEFLLVNNPVLTALTSGSPAPYKVQYQVSTSAAFTTLAWSTTLEDVTDGEHGVTTGVALPKDADSYWRVRAGDGTSWGPWSAASRLRIRFGRSAGNEFMGQSIGVQDTPVADAAEYTDNNVGCLLTLSRKAGETLHLNVGFLLTLSRRGSDYMYESGVTTDVPVPHLWFAWLNHGFVGDHVFLYGQGLGTVMAQYAAHVRMLDSNTHAESPVSVVDWSVNPAGPHAYDELRRIYAGTDGAPPVSTVEADIVELVVPSSVMTTAAVLDYFRVRTSGGVSNDSPFLLYPLVPVAMGAAASTTRTAGAVRVTVEQPYGHELPQLLMAFTPGAFTVIGGMLERPPLTLVEGSSTFTLAAGTSTALLEDPVDTPVPLSARWRPLLDDVTPRSDLGTGVSLWEPQSGASNAWRIENGTDPYVDELHPTVSRQGEITRPTMVFPGDAWMRTELEAPHNALDVRMTFVMVATVYPGTGGSGPGGTASSVLLASSMDGGLPVGTVPFTLRLIGDTLYLQVGETFSRNMALKIPPDYLSKRPLVLAVTLAQPQVARSSNPHLTHATLTMLSSATTTVSSTVGGVAAGSKLYLGRSYELDVNPARLDVLDVALGSALNQARLASLISDLDGAYGVSGA